MSNYQAVTVINEPGMVLPSSMTTEVGVLNPETLVRTRSTALSSVTPRHEKVAKTFPLLIILSSSVLFLVVSFQGFNTRSNSIRHIN